MRPLNDLADIRAIVMDVDGVLTDGRIMYHEDGSEIKVYNARDGHVIRMALRAGLKVGIFSGRASGANLRRAEDLRLSFVYQNVKDKKAGFERFLEEQHLTGEQCMYIGDDVVDIAPMKRAGFAVAVGDAVPELDMVAHMRTAKYGGCGAVREAIEFLLKGQGKWDELMERYLA